MSHFEPQPSGLMGDNFAFVTNISRLRGAASFSIAENHQLRRATAEEIPAIRETLQRLQTMPGFNPWEQRVAEGGLIERMPEADWRYHVISFRGPNHTIVELDQVFSLAQPELQIGFTFVGTGTGRALYWTPGRLFQQLDPFRWSDFVEVAAPDIENVAAIHSRLRQHDENLVGVKRLVGQIHHLGGVPANSSLQFLGYFGILEALLTHHPKPSDPYESITRQVKTKMALVNHRCQPRIDYSPFPGAPPEAIWKKMYAYRSILAHGGSASFDGELQTLGDHRKALNLLKQSVKAVIRQALIEPQLLADLRDC
jgi:hypothetical protein